MMDILYIPLGYVMKGCLWISQNFYWFAIILFSLVMEVALVYFSIKQQKTSIKQAQLRPKEIAIRRKYKNRTDRASQQQMNLEMQQMYQENGYSMFGGCLPLLIQLPIIMALYTIVRCPLQYTLFMDNNEMNAMYSYSEQLCGDLVDKLEDERDALDKEEDSERYTLIDNTIKGLNLYRENLCDYVYTDDDGNVFYLQSTDDMVSDIGTDKMTRKMKNEFIIVAVTGHFDHYIRSDLEGNGLLTEFLEQDTEVILKEAFEFDKDETYYNAIEQLPDYSFLGMSLLDTPSINHLNFLLLIPLLVFLTSFASAKLSKKLSPQTLDADGNPVKMPGGGFMTWGMPLMTLFFALNFQAALGVYWVWRSVFSMGKQILVAKWYPIPTYTQEELNQAVKELTKSKKKKKIVIEVDEDDTSYDNIKVADGDNDDKPQKPAGTRRIKMLSADDDDDDTAAAPTENDSADENKE